VAALASTNRALLSARGVLVVPIQGVRGALAGTRAAADRTGHGRLQLTGPPPRPLRQGATENTPEAALPSAEADIDLDEDLVDNDVTPRAEPSPLVAAPPSSHTPMATPTFTGDSGLRGMTTTASPARTVAEPPSAHTDGGLVVSPAALVSAAQSIDSLRRRLFEPRPEEADDGSVESPGRSPDQLRSPPPAAVLADAGANVTSSPLRKRTATDRSSLGVSPLADVLAASPAASPARTPAPAMANGHAATPPRPPESWKNPSMIQPSIAAALESASLDRMTATAAAADTALNGHDARPAASLETSEEAAVVTSAGATAKQLAAAAVLGAVLGYLLGKRRPRSAMDLARLLLVLQVSSLHTTFGKGCAFTHGSLRCWAQSLCTTRFWTTSAW